MEVPLVPCAFVCVSVLKLGCVKGKTVIELIGVCACGDYI